MQSRAEESLPECVATALAGVRALTPYLPGKPLTELEREYGIVDAVKLASNENPLGPSPAAVSAAQATLTDLGRYPDGFGFELKEALSARLGVAIESLTLGNGSNDSLELIARIFLQPGVEAIYSEYAFLVYPMVIQAIGATARVARALPADHPQQPYGHDLTAMAALVNERTGVVFIANPNNPTGTWLGRDELLAFLEQLPPRVICVLDEAYFEYLDQPDYPNGLEWLTRFPNLIVARTFSKAYGLAALRVGFVVSHPAIADLLNRARQPFNVNSSALAAATAALTDRDHLARSVALNNQGLKQLSEGLRALGLAVIPSVANFVTVDLGREAAPIYDALLRRGVITRPIAGYGLPNHLRISVGLAEENRRLLSELEALIA